MVGVEGLRGPRREKAVVVDVGDWLRSSLVERRRRWVEFMAKSLEGTSAKSDFCVEENSA